MGMLAGIDVVILVGILAGEDDGILAVVTDAAVAIVPDGILAGVADSMFFFFFFFFLNNIPHTQRLRLCREKQHS